MSESQQQGGAAAGWFLYIIETERGRLYTGITTDVQRRFEQHRSGKGGAKFFRSDPPLRVCYQIECSDRSEALKEEYRIKQLSRPQKLSLIYGSGSKFDQEHGR